MIQRRYAQRGIFEAAIGSIEQLISGLVAPELERLDAVLADEHLREAVVERLARRRPRSRTHGRPGTPAEVVLRMLVLKRLKGWTFEQTEREVRASLVYRQVTRVYFERVPDAKPCSSTPMSARAWSGIAAAAAMVTAAFVLHFRVGYGWVFSADTYTYSIPSLEQSLSRAASVPCAKSLATVREVVPIRFNCLENDGRTPRRSGPSWEQREDVC